MGKGLGLHLDQLRQAPSKKRARIDEAELVLAVAKRHRFALFR